MTREEAINYLKSSGVRIRMTRTEAINYLISSGMTEEQIETVINALTCEDCISRQAAIDLADELKDDLPDDDRLSDMVMSHNEGILEYQTKLSLLPSVTPKFTDTEIQKMQELEQAQLDKAYELGKAEMQPCEDCISREALMKLFKEYQPSLATRVCEFGDALEGLPSVTPNLK